MRRLSKITLLIVLIIIVVILSFEYGGMNSKYKTPQKVEVQEVQSDTLLK